MILCMQYLLPMILLPVVHALIIVILWMQYLLPMILLPVVHALVIIFRWYYLHAVPTAYDTPACRTLTGIYLLIILCMQFLLRYPMILLLPVAYVLANINRWYSVSMQYLPHDTPACRTRTCYYLLMILSACSTYHPWYSCLSYTRWYLSYHTLHVVPPAIPHDTSPSCRICTGKY
jgi:hypothetical protein